MQINEKALRKLIFQSLRENNAEKIESLVSVAESKQYALCSFTQHGTTYAILYDSPGLIKIVKEAIANGKFRSHNTFFLNAIPNRDIIIAGIAWGQDEDSGPCNGGQIVKTSAALDGSKMGPVVYEYALATAPGGLAPDRTSVSKYAQSVWKKYAERSGIEKKKFDNIKNPKTHDPSDDCLLTGSAALDQSYWTNNLSNSFSTLLARHSDCMQTIRQEFETNRMSSFHVIIKAEFIKGFTNLFDQVYMKNI